MQKLFLFLLVAGFIFFSACHSGETAPPDVSNSSGDSVNIFPVTSFLKAQLRSLDTLPVTPLRTLTRNGKTDSTWLKREDIRKEATPFLSPEIDSATMYPLFTEKSFLDETINAFTFSYDPKGKLPDSVHLIHWDVYMNPQTKSIQRIYMVKEASEGPRTVTTQLTWLTGKWYSIRTITEIAGQQPQVQEEKMIWNFDD